MSRTGRNFLSPGMNAAVDYIPEREESTVAIIVRGMKEVWRLRILAEGRPGPQSTGFAYVGSVRTLPWNGGDRVVAFACCPGAVKWRVEGMAQDHNTTEEPGVDFMGSPCCFDPGVRSVPGTSLENNQHFRKLEGVSGVVNVPGPLVSWTAQAGGADATVSIAQAGYPVPPSVLIKAGSTYSESDGEGAGVTSVLTFTGTVTYSVTYLAPGDGFDSA